MFLISFIYDAYATDTWDIAQKNHAVLVSVVKSGMNNLKTSIELWSITVLDKLFLSSNSLILTPLASFWLSRLYYNLS